MKILKLTMYFLIGFLLSSIAVMANAETIAATPLTGTQQPALTYNCGGYSPTLLNRYTLCDTLSAGVPSSRAFQNVNGGAYGYGQCVHLASGTPTCDIIAASCPPNTNYIGYKCISTPGYSCPSGQNWTLSGTNCTRPDCSMSEQRESDTGICIPACPAAGAYGTGPSAKNAKFNGTGTSPPTLCIGNCQYKKISTVQVGGSEPIYQSTVGASLHTTCGSNSLTTAGGANTDCLARGLGFATVNGVVVCSSSIGSPTQPITTTKEKSVTTTTPDGVPHTTIFGETKTCDGSQCTTTTTTNNSGGGSGSGGLSGISPGSGTNGTTTTTTTTPTNTGEPGSTDSKTPGTNAFCQENPNSPMCRDAITLDEPPTEGPLPVTDSNLVAALQPVNLNGNNSCPSDIPLPHGAVFSWQPVCDYASGLKPIIILLAWLSAGLIVFAGSSRT